MSIQRYSILNFGEPGSLVEEPNDEGGSWIKYVDHAELEAENATLHDRIGHLLRLNAERGGMVGKLEAAVAVLAAELARWRGVVGASCREWDLLDPFCKATDANPIASAALSAAKEGRDE